jgi:drug/metabolite transporter (DMT)-like permease
MQMNESPQAKAARNLQLTGFMRKGVMIAIVSGMLYGVYSALVSVGMFTGPWVEWYGENPTFPVAAAMVPFVVVYALGILGSGLNDIIAAVWMDGIAVAKGKFVDFLRCFKSKPGAIMIVCGIIGGPIANGAYIIALQLAGPMAATVSALCPAIGAIFGRILFKQELNARMIFGIIICLAATVIIGSSAFLTGIEIDTQFLLGLGIAFIAALGWGIEGAVGGYGTSVIDYEISISIRETVSGFTTLFILLPILCIAAGNMGLWGHLLGAAISAPSSLIWFVFSGLAAGLSFGLWYKGTSMCGAALGMACNGAYSFWVPFFCWILMGLILGWDGYALAWYQWFAAILMVVGIFLIALNPLDWFKKKAQEA